MNKKYALSIGFLLVASAYPEDNQNKTVENPVASRLVRANTLMGYPEDVCFWKPSKNNLIGKVVGSGNNAIIAFHGLGDCAHEGYAQNFKALKDTAVIVPDMPYSSRLLNKGLGKISMGGTPDIIAAALVIDEVKKARYKNICLYGFSCGGGIVVNLLRILQNPTEKYNKIFKELDIDPAKLLDSITVCVLDRPFASCNDSVRAITGGFVAGIVRAMGTKQVMINILKGNHPGNRIDFDGESPVDSAKHIRKIPIILSVIYYAFLFLYYRS